MSPSGCRATLIHGGSTLRDADRIASLVDENDARYAAGAPDQFQNRVV